MKRILFSLSMILLFVGVTKAQYQNERTGYDGDFFSLEGAIELFKDSRSLDQFERKLNSRNSYVNNLDLDYDGRTDYVRVEHRRQGNFHAIILQVALDRYDIQDVAVIEIEKTGPRDAVMQIIGDRDLYGEEVVVEPFEGTRYSTGGEFVSDNYVNVYYWPIVQSFYRRDYVVYNSPYRWNYYPTWWVTWRPYSWNVYYTRVRPYYRQCRVVTVYRTSHVHHFYQPHRQYSKNIAHRTDKVRVDRSKSQRGYTSAPRSTNNDRYGSGIKRQSPSRDIQRNQDSRYQSPGRSDEMNRRIPSERQETKIPERKVEEQRQTYRQAPSRSSNQRDKVTTPRKSSDQVQRQNTPNTRNQVERNEPQPRRSSSIQENSNRSTPNRNYSRQPSTERSSSSVRRPAPSTPKSSGNNSRFQKSTPTQKSNNTYSKQPTRERSSSAMRRPTPSTQKSSSSVRSQKSNPTQKKSDRNRRSNEQ
ncbi:MAG: hypothetical protein KDC53_11530 [Saprospiraceae bacterium]|nr:hypothetical protein [Saprospiraceae bacterium]